MMPNVLDHLAINITHSLPSPHHFHEILKKIGSAHVQAFFNEKVNEARQLGLIRDRIHIWDGQFHENLVKGSETSETRLGTLLWRGIQPRRQKSGSRSSRIHDYGLEWYLYNSNFHGNRPGK